MKIKPKIRIITKTVGPSKAQGDIFIGTDYKYMRVSDEIAELLDIVDQDFIVMGMMGKKLFIGKKPKGVFGGIMLKRGGKYRSGASKSLHTQSKSIKDLADEGLEVGVYNVNYNEEPIEDTYRTEDGGEATVTWYTLEHE